MGISISNSQEGDSFSIWNLPAEIFHHILELSVGFDQRGEIERLCTLRSVCRYWRSAVENSILWRHWTRLNNTAPPALRSLIGRTELKVNEKMLRRYIRDQEKREPSYLKKFRYLSQEFRSMGMLTPFVLRSETYIQMQIELDMALVVIWTKIRAHIQFSDTQMVPSSAQKIREWLTNPANATLIASITMLDLSDGLWKRIPPEIACFTELTSLDLSYNQLTTIPSTIGNLKQLKFLDLSGNQLSSIPDTIGNLPQLITVNLSYNPLTHLPKTINMSKVITTPESEPREIGSTLRNGPRSKRLKRTRPY